MNELSLDEKIKICDTLKKFVTLKKNLWHSKKICDTQKNGSGEEIEAGKNRVGNHKTSYENL